MTIDPSKVENSRKQSSGKIGVSLQEGSSEKQLVIQAKLLIPEEPGTIPETPAALGGNARGLDEESPADLSREAANMLELLSRQSTCVTPLSISSKAAQAVLKQF
jgi:hypothetical protein